MDILIVLVGVVIAFLLAAIGVLVWALKGWLFLGVLCISVGVFVAAFTFAVSRWAARGDIDQ